MYEFLAASGGVGPDSRLNLACDGRINVKVINALLGGATGGLGGLASTQNLAGILSGVLEGAGSSLRDDDFRDVSFNLGGTFDKPSVSNIKVGPGEKKEAAPGEPAMVEEAPLPQKILEQVVPGAKPQDQSPSDATAPSGEPPSLKDKILQQVIPGAKSEPKAPDKPAAAVTTQAAPAPKPVKEKPGPVTPTTVVEEQERQAPPAVEPTDEANSEQESGGEAAQDKEQAPPAPKGPEDVKEAPAEPGQGPLPEPPKLPKVKTFRKPPDQGMTSPDQPAAVNPPEPSGDTKAGDESAPETGGEAQPEE